MDKQKLTTAAVVVFGAAALALCAKYGVDKEVIAALGSALVLLAGTLKGLVK